jgi:hypothetical protein
MVTNEVIKCAHAACVCKVEIDEQYCSAACASKETQRVPCVCGHLECAKPEQAMEIQADESEPLPDVVA